MIEGVLFVVGVMSLEYYADDMMNLGLGPLCLDGRGLGRSCLTETHDVRRGVQLVICNSGRTRELEVLLPM